MPDQNGNPVLQMPQLDEPEADVSLPSVNFKCASRTSSDSDAAIGGSAWHCLIMILSIQLAGMCSVPYEKCPLAIWLILVTLRFARPSQCALLLPVRCRCTLFCRFARV